MTKDELVPEIHDIGKLMDKNSTGIQHNFENYPGRINGLPLINESATWEGIKEHHCQVPTQRKKQVLTEYPKSLEAVILCIADSLASTVSRHLEIKGSPRYNVYKLWNPMTNIPDLMDVLDTHLTEKEWLKKIVRFVNGGYSSEEYFSEFGTYLKKRCEDAYPGANITSLYTHSVLTGKFYKILKDLNLKVQLNLKHASKQEICELVNRKLPNKLRLVISKIKINLPQYMYRTKDLNAIKIKENIIKSFQKHSEIFFVTSDEIILFANDETILNELRETADKYGFILTVFQKSSRLIKKEFENTFRSVLNENTKELIYYPEFIEKNSKIPSKVGLCEICQLNPVDPYEILSKDEKRVITDDKSGIVENLCRKCLNIRKSSKSLEKLAVWENTFIIWLKITLNFGKLVKSLEQLYSVYLGFNDFKVEINPSLVAEFQWDYNNFLNSFNNKIIEEFKEEDVEFVLKDLYCIKIENLCVINKILKIYEDCVIEFFPQIKETDESPIKLVISESSVKFPFFEHWKYLNNPQNDIDIKLIGKGEMRIELSKLDDLLKLNLGDKTALHKLAKMAEISKELAYMEIISQEGKKDHPDLQKAIFDKHFDVSDILTYIKIKGD